MMVIMTHKEKLDLIFQITRKICEEPYLHEDVHYLLRGYSGDLSEPIYSSEYGYLYTIEAYTKQLLREFDENSLRRIAADFGLFWGNFDLDEPSCWANKKSKIKVFISHLSSDKHNAHRLKSALEVDNFIGFVAHDDIEPTSEWRKEILRALNNMDIFVCLISENYKDSFWCQQEIGYAMCRGKTIIPIKFDATDPLGFISAYQAINRGEKRAEQVVQEIIDLIQTNDKLAYIKDKIVTQDIEVPF
jgi:hypothetical protein